MKEATLYKLFVFVKQLILSETGAILTQELALHLQYSLLMLYLLLAWAVALFDTAEPILLLLQIDERLSLAHFEYLFERLGSNGRARKFFAHLRAQLLLAGVEETAGGDRWHTIASRRYISNIHSDGALR